MNRVENNRTILMALLGCLLIGVYFWVASRSKVTRLLQQELPRSEIVAIAEQAYNNSEFVYYDMRRTVELNVDNNLLRYAQVYLDDEKVADLPIGEWMVTWRGSAETKEEGVQEVVFSVHYDFEGNLIGLRQDAPELKMPPNLGELEARIEARRFLHSQNVETDDLQVEEQFASKSGGSLQYDFVFSRPSTISPNLVEDYQVTITGQNITEYRARLIL
ncbi:hypothetical protein MJD09_21405, partial [bacterium]|nr:hypothetical protein [bacterium]